MSDIQIVDLFLTLAVVLVSGGIAVGIIVGMISESRERRRRQRLAGEILRGLREPTWREERKE